MDVLGDLIGPERRSDQLVYERPGDRSRSYSYASFCTDAWKAGNLLRHYGVREGATVGVLDGPKAPADTDDRTGTPVPESLLALFGATLLGANVLFDPGREPDVRALIGPAAWLDRYELPPGSKALAFGGPPDDPTVAHFERELWSENPIPFPEAVDPDATALRPEHDEISHRSLLTAAREAVDDYGLTDEHRVAVDAALSDPGTVVAGVFAPMLAGGTVVVSDDATPTDANATLVVSKRASGENVIDPRSWRPR